MAHLAGRYKQCLSILIDSDIIYLKGEATLPLIDLIQEALKSLMVPSNELGVLL